MHPLYDALSGPTASSSQIRFILPERVEQRTQRAFFNSISASIQRQIKPYTRDVTPLYLYHGKRFCVDKQNDDESDANLFQWTVSSSFDMYDHQKKKLWLETLEGVRNELRRTMGTSENNQCGIVQLFLERKNENFDSRQGCSKTGKL